MKEPATFRRQIRLMGSAFEFVIVAAPDAGESLLDDSIAEVKRLETLLTEFSETSQTALINRMAGQQPVAVDDEVFSLLQRCDHISKLTQGAFDITASGLKKLYNFKGGDVRLPSKRQLQEALSRCGYEKVQLLQPGEVYLLQPGMHVGFGAIGKGYAADRVKKLLVNKGVTSGVINASGDLTAWGVRPDGTDWRVGVADPNQPERAMLYVPVKNASVATSGDYEQYFDWQGQRYSHTINPKTGLPVTGVKSVTVVSPSAELSDALATAVFIMGASVGLHFIEQLPDTHALVIDDRNTVHYSSHLKFNHHAQVTV